MIMLLMIKGRKLLSVLECHGCAGLLEGRTVMVPIVGSTTVSESLSGIEWLLAVEEDVLLSAVPFSALILLTGPCALLVPLPVVLVLGAFLVVVVGSFVVLVGVGTGKLCVKGSGGMVRASVSCVAFSLMLAATAGVTTSGPEVVEAAPLLLPLVVRSSTTGVLDEEATRSRSDKGNGCTEDWRFFCAGAVPAVPKVAVTDGPEGRLALAFCVACCDSRSHCAICFVPDCKLKTLLTATAVSKRDKGPAGPGTSLAGGLVTTAPGLAVVWIDG